MTLQEQLEIAIPLGVAAVGGLAVGIEREWSARAEGKSPRFAGVRTFLLMGLLGAVSIQIIRFGYVSIGAIVLAAAALLVVIAYAAAAHTGDRESTTEFAAILVLAAGAFAGAGKLAMASAMNAFTALVLVEKSRIHSLVFRIQSEELRAGFRFAVLALVVLPLLPSGPYGPEPGIRPRELWALVLLFSGLSFAGFIARRAAGAERGYRLAGLLGGLISSTLVTLNFSRESRSQPSLGQALGFGVIAACTVLPVRILLLTTALNHDVGIATIPYLFAPFLVGVLIVLATLQRSGPAEVKLPTPKNPLRFLLAIQMVVAFQAALYAMKWVSSHFGTTGVMVTAALVGFTDMDTLTFMIAKQNDLAAGIAAQALTLGVFTNTVLKFTLALMIGKGSFRLITAVGLALLGVVTLVSLLAI